MRFAATLRRRLARAFSPGGAERHAIYTALEVRCRLRQAPESNPRTAAVHAAAADVGAWTALLAPSDAYELGRAADRLPSVVFWFCRGRRLDEIGRELTPFGSTWDGDQAVTVASHLIAHLLNQQPAPDAPGSAHHTHSA
jgi:hypothetical protein